MRKRQPRRGDRSDQTATPVASSGLCVSFDLSIHGFAPVATVCRPFGTHELAPNRYVEVDSESAGLSSGTLQSPVTVMCVVLGVQYQTFIPQP